MTCQILFGNDAAGMKWRWLLNGQPVNNTDRVQITTVNGTTWQSRLSIREIRLNEAGQYECFVANAFGNASQYIQVNVHGLPFLHKLNIYIFFVTLINSTVFVLIRYALGVVAIHWSCRRDYRFNIVAKVLSDAC